MSAYDIVIVGGGPAGVSCAISAKNTYPNKRIALIRREPKPMVPCGIPYVLHTLKDVTENVLPDAPLHASQVEILNDEVVGRRDHAVLLAEGGEVHYQKLVLAVGSNAVMPPIEGSENENVYLIRKDMDYLLRLKASLQVARRVVILGGGYIGVEVADELIRGGNEVTVVEMMDTLLPTMDAEFGEKLRAILESAGGKVVTGKSVQRILGDGRVSGVELSDGTILGCDLLIVSCGYRPNLDLADMFGLTCHPGKGILVDDYLRTSDKDIFAVGDCACKYDFFTGEFCNIMLASTAVAEGRLVGSNLFSIKVIRKYQGVLGTFATKIQSTAFAMSGMTESRARSAGLDYTVGQAVTVDRHPGKLPNASGVTVKLVFSTYSHHLLGGQIMGGDSVGEMINMVSVMILNKLTDMDIDTLQIGTHPLLTASPIAYPIINATTDAIKKWYRG